MLGGEQSKGGSGAAGEAGGHALDRKTEIPVSFQVVAGEWKGCLHGARGMESQEVSLVKRRQVRVTAPSLSPRSSLL